MGALNRTEWTDLPQENGHIAYNLKTAQNIVEHQGRNS